MGQWFSTIHVNTSQGALKMTTVLLWLLGLLIFLVVLVVSVGLHEAGHMYFGKKFGLKVPKFFVGFGPTLWSFKTKKTEYGIKAVPLGGFVTIEDPKVEEPDTTELEQKIADETISEKERKEHKKKLKKIKDSYILQKGLLSNVEPWKRIIIYAAGPAVNLVLGIGILYTVLMAFDSFVVNNTVQSVNQCSEITASESCEGAKSGIQAGDQIVAIDGERVKPTEDVSPFVKGKEEIDLTVVRDGEEIQIHTGLKNNLIGVNLTPEVRPLNFAEATDTMIGVVDSSIQSLIKLPEKMPAVAKQTFVGGERDPEAPSSVVHAGKTYGDTAADVEIPTASKFQLLVTYSGLLNLSLGIINLIPVLTLLDGGKITIAVIDQFKIWFSKIFRRKYKPLGEFAVTAMTLVSVAIVVGFMGLLMLSDIVNIFRGQL